MNINLNEIRSKIDGITHPTPIKRILKNDYEVLKQHYETSEWKEIIYCLKNNIDVHPKSNCGNNSKYHNGKFLLVCINYKNGDNSSCPICHQTRTEISTEKCKNTSIIKYGTEFPNQADIVKDKIRTSLKNIDYDEVNDKRSETTRKKYGVSNIMKLPEVAKDISTKAIQRHATPEFKDKMKNIFIEKRKELVHSLTNNVQHSPDTKYEDELFNFIKENYNGNIILNDRSVIPPQEIDIYLPDLKLGIEFNGNYWHSTKFLDKNYHKDKVLKCSEVGVRLINIYDSDYILKKDVVLNRILNAINVSERIYARNCEIRMVSNADANAMLDKYHLQGSMHSSIRIGLYYNNILVALGTFGQSRYYKDAEYELHRYCSSGTVIGGFSKILKYFERNYDYTTLCTYADLNWGTGELYTKTGFTFVKYTDPNYWYFKYPNVYLSRYQCQKKKLIEMFGEQYSSYTEDAIMKIHRYNKVYGAGNILFVKEKPKL